MKKNKLLKVCLITGTIGSLVVSTPIILTSCQDNSNSEIEGNKPNENTPNQPGQETESYPILQDNFLSLLEPNSGMKLERIPGTNNFNFYVGESTVKCEQAKKIIEAEYLNKYLTKEQIKELGFTSLNGPISFGISWLTKTGKYLKFWQPDELFQDYDETKPFTITAEFVVMQGWGPNSIKHYKQIPIKVTMIPESAH